MSDVVSPAAAEATASRAFGGASVTAEQLAAAPLRCVPRPERLDRPLASLRGVGEKTAAAASRLGLRTLGDLVENVPHSYGERGEIALVAELRPGERATLLVEVRSARLRPTRR